MRSFQYNPFGSTTSTYSPNSSFEKRKPQQKTWVKVAVFVAVSVVVLSIVSYALMFFYAQETKRNANDAIDGFNSSLGSAYQTFSDPGLPVALKESADKLEKVSPEGAQNKKVIANRMLADFSTNLKDAPVPTYRKEASDMEMTVMVAPYYAMCDLVEYSAPTQSYDLKTLCTDFGDKAKKMMADVRGYNNMTSSPIGTLTGNTEKYADVLKSDEELSKSGKDNTPQEPGK